MDKAEKVEQKALERERKTREKEEKAREREENKQQREKQKVEKKAQKLEAAKDAHPKMPPLKPEVLARGLEKLAEHDYNAVEASADEENGLTYEELKQVLISKQLWPGGHPKQASCFKIVQNKEEIFANEIASAAEETVNAAANAAEWGNGDSSSESDDVDDGDDGEPID